MTYICILIKYIEMENNFMNTPKKSSWCGTLNNVFGYWIQMGLIDKQAGYL